MPRWVIPLACSFEVREKVEMQMTCYRSVRFLRFMAYQTSWMQNAEASLLKEQKWNIAEVGPVQAQHLHQE